MNCKMVIRELCDFLDGDLAASLAQDLEKHLSECEDCHLVVDTTRKTIEIYCNTEPMSLPAAVQQRLHAALAEKLNRQNR